MDNPYSKIQYPEPPPELKAMLQLLVDGMSQKQIAAALGITHEAARAQLRRCRHRMAAHTTEHLVALAVCRGWLLVPDWPQKETVLYR